MKAKYYLDKFEVIFGNRPIYKYIDVKKYYCEGREDFEEIMDVIDFTNTDGEAQEWEHFDLRMVDDNYKADCILLTRYYGRMRRMLLNPEYHFGKKSTEHERESSPYEGTKEILSAIKKTHGLKLTKITLSFKDEIIKNGKTIRANDKNISFTNKEILKELLPRIKEGIDDHLERYPIVENVRAGQKSTYIRKWGVSLYPFFLYLKEFVFPKDNDVYIYDFISKCISVYTNSFWTSDEEYMKEHANDWQNKPDIIDRENLQEWFKKKNLPPVKIILNPPYPD